MEEQIGETFDQTKFKIISEWGSTIGERYRLIDFSAGPLELQVKRGDENWEKEKGHFEWGVLTHRIKSQDKLIEDLKDFAIWMTGCGYDFTQHEYFNKKRDELLKETMNI